MDAVSKGNMGAAPKVFGAASGLPSPSAFGSSLAEATGGLSLPSMPAVSSALGLDKMAKNAIDGASQKLGDALGLDGGGGGGASGGSMAGPDGAVGSNSGSDSTTGPGYSVNICSATHAETVGSLKAMIAASGIHTTVTGARTQDVGAARVELVLGNRV